MQTDLLFRHGLGDCVHLALMLPQYFRKGHDIGICCEPDKRPLFEAAGVTRFVSTGIAHPFPHSKRTNATWEENKVGYNLCLPPLPELMYPEECWKELLAEKLPPLPGDTSEVDDWFDTLTPPVIVLHAIGVSLSGSKSLDAPTIETLYQELLDMSGATVVVYDRSPKIIHSRLRYWKTDKLHLLQRLLSRADLLIGVDSGLLHFCRTTDTPALGLWTGHRPHQFALPREKTLNLATYKPDHWWSRDQWQIADVKPAEKNRHSAEGVMLRAEDIRYFAVELLEGVEPRSLVHEAMLGLTSEVRDGSYRDRHIGFAKFYGALPAEGLVVECGACRCENDFSAGNFTYHGGYWLRDRLHTVDIDPKAVKVANKVAGQFGVTVHERDSRNFLRGFSGNLVGAYLDSSDTNAPGSLELCLEEAILCHQKGCKVILIDDAPNGQGKGRLAIPWLMANNWHCEWAGYQVLMVRD